MAAYLVLENLTKRYPGTDSPSVDSINLTINRGEFVSFLGPSGCGKTTTLRMIAGLLETTDGDIILDGESLINIPVHKRGLGMVFQSYALFPHLTVFDNVAFGLKLRKQSREEIKQRVTEALQLVHLDHLANRKIKQLSGGQQQRIALARALVIKPRVLLLDEPLSNLDAKLREKMREEIRAIQQTVGITTIFVTHDQEEAMSTSDRIVVMSEGTIEQVGSPEEIYRHPKNRFVAEFIGQANFLPLPLHDKDTVFLPSGTPVPVPDSVTPHENMVTVVIRPEDLQVGDHGAPGKIVSASYVGSSIHYVIELAEYDMRLRAEVGGREASILEPGTDVHVRVPAELCFVLDGVQESTDE